MQLVHGLLDHDVVDEPDGADDLEPLFERHHWALALVTHHQLIGAHADDEPVAVGSWPAGAG